MGLNQEGHLHPSVCSSCQPDLPSEPLRIAETLPVKNNDLEQEQDSAPDPPRPPPPIMSQQQYIPISIQLSHTQL